jgi:alpha-L-fucosidase
MYAIYLLDEGEGIPGAIQLKNVSPEAGATIRLLGSDIELKWQRDGAGARIVLPEAVRNQSTNSYAISLRISAI